MYKGHGHVYKCCPLVGVNKRLPEGERCTVSMTVAGYPEQDAENLASQRMLAAEVNTRWAELTSQRLHELVRGHFKSATNVCEGLEDCQDFDAFVAKADPEIVQWVFGAVYKAQILDAAEIKNSDPGSDSA